ncbi:acyl-CoA synthetase [Phyllobacterium brassicacearum]|uniref:3-methylmercaptopropionyl-CoA ligase n=1 Tax=Phyllobacterium brassicacearum TaxID=314235 RepID=A0A2P7BRL8_9HYPH|nr:acyl-CoA synthetase [Phyllobacterium brassicacearum]PSH69098.1 acyl-CoA synthetase [Phyllobacterium brassicacearum]TDQ25354.1 fatty-acyl-CoA synthase [Phyllobacterium brassicacearum]
MGGIFDQDLERCAANHQPLTPLSYLERAARVYPSRTAIIHGSQHRDYGTFYRRACQLASALARQGIGKGDTVTVMLSNTPPMLEAHFGVPMTKAVLHSLNTRLDAAVIAFQLDHAETKLAIVDSEFSTVFREALKLAKVQPTVIDFVDDQYPADAPYPQGERIGDLDYNAFIESGDPDHAWSMPDDEWDAITLNYTSGTTGNPKGVVYHHRGAALMGYGNIIASGMGRYPVYLWTLPMFHCNGWCFPWTLALQFGTHVCLRWVRAKQIYESIADHGVTHLCGAPIVMSTLINAPASDKRTFPQTVTFNTAAAPPPESILAGMADAGFAVTHLYGLTETYGPAVVNEWQDEWDVLETPSRTAKKARQGVRYAALEDLAVLDPETMQPVTADGETIGEVMFRGNIVMKGYLKNRQASDEAFAGGWFHSGDLGVMHPDGYIQLKDRSKDIIISGGENISSIEVEDAIYKFPAVSACAVVARPDDKWGETPLAFVELKPGHEASEEELIAHCRKLLAKFKCPRHVLFESIPKTSTGKIQKFELRKRAKLLSDG